MLLFSSQAADNVRNQKSNAQNHNARKASIKNIANRSGKDVILTSKLLPYYKENYVYDNFRRYNRFQTSSVLPYMGPDTNAEEFTPLYEKFLCTSHAQKICLDNIGDILNFYV